MYFFAGEKLNEIAGGFSFEAVHRIVERWSGKHVSPKSVDEEDETLLEKLRKLGIIRRRGLYSRFGWKSRVWHDPSTDSYFPGGFPPDLVQVEEDVGPSIVVRVLGSLDDASFEGLGTDTEFDEIMEDVKTGVDSVRQMTHTNSGMADEIPPQMLEQLVSKELLDDANATFRCITQMLCSALPKCAETERTLVVTSGCGKLQTALASAASIFASSDRGSLKHISLNSEWTPNCALRLQLEGCETEKAVVDLLDQLWMDGKTVRRKRAAIAYVLVGGAESQCSKELLHAVQRKWPIFVLEGSKGYADHLCSLLRRIGEMHPNSGVDEIRASTASAAPEVAEILTQGDITAVSPGSSVKEFQQAVLFSLRGDETLRQAWSHFAHWHHNEALYNRHTRILQVIILLLGILTMSLTIIQSFLQLLYPTILGVDASSLSAGEVGVRIFLLGNNLALIVLPILTSLFQAVLFKSDPATKYVTLRRCSQLMLREIFMYRTHTRGYSASAVNSQRRKISGADNTAGDAEDSSDTESSDDAVEQAESGVKPRGDVDERLLDTWNDNEGYFSRQDLLFRRISALSEDVSSAMADAPLWEYEGPLPPESITEKGDDGFTFLSPAAYIKFRLDVACESYVESSRFYRQQFYALTYSIYVFGSIGTMLAAFAVYGSVSDLNLQFWVALTTSVQNALSRFLDYTRVEHLMQEHSKAKENLTVVASWWSQLEQPTGDTDSQMNRDSLVGRVETCITREVEESGSHMKNLVSRMRKAQEQQEYEDELLERQLESGSLSARFMQIQSLGIGCLTAEKIKAALNDPACPVSGEIVQALDRIEEVFESRPLEDDELDRMRRLEESLKTKSFAEILGEGIRDHNFVPVDVRNMLRDPKLLPRIDEEIGIAKGFVVNRSTLLRLAKVKTELSSEIVNFPLRRVLLTFKSVLEDLVVSQFEKSLESINVNIYNLVGTRSEAANLIGELSGVVLSPDWQSQSLDSILADIKDADLHKSIRSLGESTIRAMLKRAERFFTSRTGAPALLSTILRLIATIDVDELMSDPQSTLDRANIRAEMLRDRMFTRKKSKVELLELLPPSIRQIEAVASQSKTQLIAYFDEIVDGGFEFDVMEAVVKASASSAEHLPSFLRSPEGQSRFYFSICDINHDQILNVSHDITHRLMAVSPFFTQSFANELRSHYTKPRASDETNTDFVSVARTAMSKSFQLNQFRLICNSVVDMDVALLVPTQKDRICLVNLVLDGILNPQDSNWESASEVLLSVTPRIAQRLQSVNFSQLIGLLGTMSTLCNCVVSALLVAHAFQHVERYQVDFPQWSRIQCTRFLYSCLISNSRATISDRVVLDMFDAVVGEGQEKIHLQDALFKAVKEMKVNGKDVSFPVFCFLLQLDNLGLLSRDMDSVSSVFSIMTVYSESNVTPTLFIDMPTVIEAMRLGLEKSGFEKSQGHDKMPFLDWALRYMFVFGPFVIFDGVAKRCCVLDLHAVFPRQMHQYLLIAALHRVCDGDDENRMVQSFYSLLNEGLFDQMFSIVGKLTEKNVLEIVRSFREIQGDLFCGTIFKMHRIPNDVSFTMCVHTRVAHYTVSSRGVFHPDFVSKQLFNLDVNSFLTALPDDKARRLADAVDDEEIATTICKLSAERVKLWFSLVSGVINAPRELIAVQRVQEGLLLQTLGDCVD